MTSILPQDHSTHVFNVLFVICTLFGIEIVAPGRSVPLASCGRHRRAFIPQAIASVLPDFNKRVQTTNPKRSFYHRWLQVRLTQC